jgi:integrase
MTKLLKAFFNYLNVHKGINTGTFYKTFHSPSEEIEILVLSPERLNYLVHSKALEEKLNEELKTVKDIFVFGCSVALRFSDLMNLGPANLENTNGRLYLKVQSKKTQTFTRVKLPDYAITILNTYYKTGKRFLLPQCNKVYLNKKIKLLMHAADFTEEVIKTRQKRGIPVCIARNGTKANFRFCDLITTHSMRRTAITTMLSLGMNEQAVRKISGHAANSKEFYRYVSFAQAYMDNEIDQMHQKLNTKQLEFA